MSYIDPYMQMQLLGPLGAPQSDFSQTPTQPIGQPLNALTGPLGVSQGYMPDPELQRRAQMMAGFQNLASLGGYQIGNPYQQQIAQNMQLAQQRMAQIGRNQNPSQVREYEYFNSLNPDQQQQYLKLKRGDRQSVYDSKMEDLTSLMGGDAQSATKLANGLLEVKTGPNGELGVYDKSTGEFRTDMTPDTIAAGKAMIAGAQTGATESQKNKWEVIGNVETTMSELADEWEASYAGVMRGRDALEMIKSGQADTGLLQGLMLDYLGMGDYDLARFNNMSTQQIFEELSSNTLTPVSDADIRQLAKLFASASQSPEVARGNLESFLLRKERELERKSGRMRRELRRIDDADYRDSMSTNYERFLQFKALTTDDEVRKARMAAGG